MQFWYKYKSKMPAHILPGALNAIMAVQKPYRHHTWNLPLYFAPAPTKTIDNDTVQNAVAVPLCWHDDLMNLANQSIEERNLPWRLGCE